MDFDCPHPNLQRFADTANMADGKRTQPGVRTSLRPFLYIFVLLQFLASPIYAASAVLGIDLGTEYIKAALVKPGIPLDIVLTKDSKRKELAAVAFKPLSNDAPGIGQFPERLYGGDALALAARFPGDVFANLKPLLPNPLQDMYAADEYRRLHPALDVVHTQTAPSLAFRSKSFAGDDGLFSVEELLAMELKSIRENAQLMAGRGHTIRDAVITVPAFYTAQERRAVELAAELAGLKVIGLISDGLAVGLNYATSRTFRNVDQGEKPEHHLVYDMGAGSTTATVLKFQARTVKDVGRYNKTVQEVTVIGTGWDRHMGGDQLNVLILEDMLAKFVDSSAAKKAGVETSDVKGHGRAMSKLWKEAERVRQVLSANSATSSSFEGLYDDVDFRYKLSRVEFEEMVSSYENNIAKPIGDALAVAGLTVADLDSVVLHGGAVRTPFIQKRLEAIIGDAAKLRSNVNADEAAVFGAAFKAAGLSPSFRVKEIRSSDTANYGALLRWTAGGKERQQKIFVPTSQVGTVKQLPFNAQEDLTVSISQQVPSIEDASNLVELKVSEITFTNLTSSAADLIVNYGCGKDALNTMFSMRLSPVTGLPEISDATISCEVEGIEKKGGVVDDVKGFFGFGKKDGSGSDSTESPELIETLTATDSSSSPGTSDASSASSSKAAKTSKAAAKKKKKIQTVPLSMSFGADRGALPSNDELMRMKERLTAFDRSDRNRAQREEQYNVLEGATYRVRDLLTDSAITDVSTDAQRDEIKIKLGEISEWLSTEGATADIEAIRTKNQQLRALVDPVRKRKDEVTKRPQAVETLNVALQQAQNMMTTVSHDLMKASAAAASITSEESSSITAASSEATDDLEDDAGPTISIPAQIASFTPLYSEDDQERLRTTIDDAREWLSEQTAAQEKLSASDDPALLSVDITALTEQLDRLVEELKRRRPKIPPRSSTSRVTKIKTPRTSSTNQSVVVETPAAAVDSDEAPEPVPGESLETETLVEAPTEAADEGDPTESPSARDEL